MEVKDLIGCLEANRYDGSSVEPGIPYQNIPSLGIKGHRDKSDWRARRICELVGVKDRRVLDLGCSVGTMSGVFKENGAGYVLGVDHDPEAIAIASHLYPNVEFKVASITKEFLDTLPHFDVVVWTSQFMWMVKQHGMDYALDFLFELSKKCDYLVFESAAREDGLAPIAMDQEDFVQTLILNTCFQDVLDCGPWSDNWAPRNVFVCSKPRLGWETNYLSRVDRVNRGMVRKTYKQSERAVEIMRREILFLRTIDPFPYFPKVLATAPYSFDMPYHGCPTAWIPEVDLDRILSFLDHAGITHRDITPDNILWNGKHCVLIDFAYAILPGDVTNYHYDLGKPFKSPYGYSNEFALRKSQFVLMEAQCNV